MRMVKESKNERLTLLLEETNKLLVNLGAAVQRQKDSKHTEGIEALKDSEGDLTELEEDLDIIDSDRNDDSSDLLKGQRQYNSAIHSIQEQVREKATFSARNLLLYVFFPYTCHCFPVDLCDLYILLITSLNYIAP